MTDAGLTVWFTGLSGAGKSTLANALEAELRAQGRKVEPLERILHDADAWLTGLRRTQSDRRATTPVVEVDVAHGGIAKVNPVATWSDEQVRAHLSMRGVPLHPLYARGYTSIGCDPCTRAVEPGEHERAGRWWWEDGVDKECGIHGRPDTPDTTETQAQGDE